MLNCIMFSSQTKIGVMKNYVSSPSHWKKKKKMLAEPCIPYVQWRLDVTVWCRWLVNLSQITTLHNIAHHARLWNDTKSGRLLVCFLASVNSEQSRTKKMRITLKGMTLTLAKLSGWARKYLGRCQTRQIDDFAFNCIWQFWFSITSYRHWLTFKHKTSYLIVVTTVTGQLMSMSFSSNTPIFFFPLPYIKCLLKNFIEKFGQPLCIYFCMSKLF